MKYIDELYIKIKFKNKKTWINKCQNQIWLVIKLIYNIY